MTREAIRYMFKVERLFKYMQMSTEEVEVDLKASRELLGKPKLPEGFKAPIRRHIAELENARRTMLRLT